jgi:hypothetical protein
VEPFSPQSLIPALGSSSIGQCGYKQPEVFSRFNNFFPSLIYFTLRSADDHYVQHTTALGIMQQKGWQC